MPTKNNPFMNKVLTDQKDTLSPCNPMRKNISEEVEKNYDAMTTFRDMNDAIN